MDRSNGVRVESLGRRAFFRSLTCEPSSSSAPPVPVAPVTVDGAMETVKFTLKRLREFQSIHLHTASFKKVVQPTGKRPNYNNSRRKLLSKPTSRVK